MPSWLGEWGWLILIKVISSIFIFHLDSFLLGKRVRTSSFWYHYILLLWTWTYSVTAVGWNEVKRKGNQPYWVVIKGSVKTVCDLQPPWISFYVNVLQRRQVFGITVNETHLMLCSGPKVTEIFSSEKQIWHIKPTYSASKCMYCMERKWASSCFNAFQCFVIV